MDLGLNGRVVLVITPNLNDRQALEQLLADEGAVVAGASAPAGALEALFHQHGRIDGLVLGLPQSGPSSVATSSVEELDAAWSHVVDLVDTMRTASQAMAAGGWGRIVTILPAETKWLHDESDEVGVISGLGMLGLNKAAVADLAPSGVAVNALLRSSAASSTEVADAAAFLLSDGAGYLHGVTISLDGAKSPAMF